MVLKIYGALISTNTQRALVTLKEKGVPYEFIPKQPFGQIPYIDDDGFIIFESVAISRYIAAKYRSSGTPLLPDPADVEAVALLDQAICIEASDFYPITSKIVLESYVKVLFGGEVNTEAVAKLASQLDSKLDGYERLLGRQRYLAGNNITVADLAHLPSGSLISYYGVELLEDAEKRPNVARWWRDIASRSSWQEVKATSFAAAGLKLDSLTWMFSDTIATSASRTRGRV
ncbi:glutathione S-transferase [Irpex lacteus]|nr:glutathione S-transferase [Irpex lacteus]